MSRIVVLSGAGISAESGVKTFRESGGLWEDHDVMEVASIEGWYRNPNVVLEFYNQRRRQLSTVQPNKAHLFFANLERIHQVDIVTQNVDDLHERAGSTNVTHLHGELLKSRCSKFRNLVYDCTGDIHLGDLSEKGHQLRPDIVWFGEEVPKMDQAIELCLKAEVLIIIGTSMQVYPAAGLIQYIPNNIPIYFIDPNPNINKSYPNLTIIQETATAGVEELKRLLT